MNCRSEAADPFEIADILSTFRVICDNREQKTPRAAERFKALGAIEKGVLDYGDYCANVDISGLPLYDISARVYPSCVIERKMGLDELASCFTHSRERFHKEFERAQNNGAKVYLLVENASWEAILMHRYKSQFRPEAFKASLVAWMTRYDITPIFCKSDVSGEIIREILFRDMREQLERGAFDGIQRQ